MKKVTVTATKSGVAGYDVEYAINGQVVSREHYASYRVAENRAHDLKTRDPLHTKVETIR